MGRFAKRKRNSAKVRVLIMRLNEWIKTKEKPKVAKIILKDKKKSRPQRMEIDNRDWKKKRTEKIVRDKKFEKMKTKEKSKVTKIMLKAKKKSRKRKKRNFNLKRQRRTLTITFARFEVMRKKDRQERITRMKVTLSFSELMTKFEEMRKEEEGKKARKPKNGNLKNAGGIWRPDPSSYLQIRTPRRRPKQLLFE